MNKQWLATILSTHVDTRIRVAMRYLSDMDIQYVNCALTNIRIELLLTAIRRMAWNVRDTPPSTFFLFYVLIFKLMYNQSFMSTALF